MSRSMLLFLAMCIAASSASSGPVCDVLSPVFPTALGCSCTTASSGIGGTSSCPLTLPSVTIVAATHVSSAVKTPAITIALGASVLPCGNPASASIHGSISLPADLPSSIQTQIQGIDGITLSATSSAVTLEIEKSVGAGASPASIDIPVLGVTGASVDIKIGLSVTGNIAALKISQTLDVCIKLGIAAASVTYCGADLSHIPTLGSTIASALLNPPWTLLSGTLNFDNACAQHPPPPASGTFPPPAAGKAASPPPPGGGGGGGGTVVVHHHHGMDGGAVAGLVIGLLALFAIIAGVAFWALRTGRCKIEGPRAMASNDGAGQNKVEVTLNDAM